MSNAPRSGQEQVAGISWLARMIDKARLDAAGEIEPYDLVFPCPMDQQLLAKLGIDAKSFQAIVTSNANDEGIVTALKEHGVALAAR